LDGRKDDGHEPQETALETTWRAVTRDLLHHQTEVEVATWTRNALENVAMAAQVDAPQASCL
jgi:hypothetical protein